MSSGLPGAKVRIALGREVVPGGGPAALAVEGDLVLVEAAGLEALDADQRVVVPADREGRLAAAEDLDLAGLARSRPRSSPRFRRRSAAGGRG